MKNEELTRLGVAGLFADAGRLRPLLAGAACIVYNTANQSIPDATWTALTFNSEESDEEGMHSTTSNTSRITAQTGGLFFLGGTVQFAPASGGKRGIAVRVNNANRLGFVIVDDAGASDAVTLSTAVPWYLSEGDYAEIVVYQDSGGALNSRGTVSTYVPLGFAVRLW